MGLVNAVYSWGSVKTLYYTVFSMNLAGLVALLFAIVWAVRFERGFGDYLNLVTPGDGHAWTMVILSAAVFCSPVYILGVKCWLCLKLEPTRNDLENQQKADAGVDPHDANRLLFIHVVACLLSGFLLAILNATYLVLLSGFQQKSRDGLIEAMEKYGSDVTVKARLDAVQTELECCGDNSYEDWFRVPWLKLSMEVLEETDKGPRLEGQTEGQEEEPSTTADVPFSCCSNDIPKPCVHHDILNPSAVYEYDPKRLTISTIGCRSKILSRGESIRIYLAGYLALLSVYQVVLSFLARLLQTAHANEFYIGPEKTRYHVWIVFSPSSQDNVPLIRNNGNEEPRGRSRNDPNQELSSSSTLESSSQEDEEEEEINISTKLRKTRSSSAKILKDIRSKLPSVKAKSLPLIRPRRVFSWKVKGGKKKVYATEEYQEEKSSGRSRKTSLPSTRKVKSQVRIKEDQYLSSSSSEGTSTPDLPSPPPPPPFAATLKLESVEEFTKPGISRFPREELNTRQPPYESIITNPNSGRRVKVLEKFDSLSKRNETVTQQRERGGADEINGSTHSSESRGPPIRSEFAPTDVYDRFRGTLQHTLARREAIRARRGTGRLYPSNINSHLDVRRSNVLERLRCNNVPPSYRLLANIDVERRPALQTHPKPSPPPLANSFAANSAPSSRTKASFRRRRQCNICNRPVQRSPESSAESLSNSQQDPRTFPPSWQRRTISVSLTREMERSRRDYTGLDRSTFISKSVQRR